MDSRRHASVVVIAQPAATSYVHGDTLTLSYSVTDAGSGLAETIALLDNASTVGGHGLVTGQAIDLLTELTVGEHTFSIRAADNLENATLASVTFSIVVTPESIEGDVPRLVERGDIAPNMATPLGKKLEAAAKARASGNCKTAANLYGAFVNLVQAQDGKKIDAAAAAILIGDANYLVTHCP